jgi:ATP-dependent Clp protease adaptor protein ClpS
MADSGVQEQTESQTSTQTARPWNVVVHDDPISLMSYVTQIFQTVFGYSRSKAERLMLEVHNEGRSIVWTGPREQAEIYVAKLLGFYLRTTLEQSE